MEIPVYLFTGFLFSGKTKFIQETLEDGRFNSGEKTLILLCEQGDEEFDPSSFASDNCYVETLESEQELNSENLAKLLKKHGAVRVIIEYNGMWSLDNLYGAIPREWVVYQQMMFADSNDFTNINANMRSLVYDKLKSAEMVIFNRFSENTDKLELHKIVRAVSRNTPIIYEYSDGSIENDDIEDPLPFDLEASKIVIKDEDFAIWYRDMMENLQKYDKKTVEFTGVVVRDKKLSKTTFIIGRHVMTCCIDDVQYVGLVATTNSDCTSLSIGDWVKLTATISVEKNKIYDGKGPVLKAISYALTSAPEVPLATF